MDRSTYTGSPSMSQPHHHMAVEYVDGVGVKTWTCSGCIESSLPQKRASSLMSSSVQPGWAAMK